MNKKQIIGIEKANINDLDNIYEFVCLLENQSFNKGVFRKIFVVFLSRRNSRNVHNRKLSKVRYWTKFN